MMLQYAGVFLISALVAGILCIGGVATGDSRFAEWMFFIAVALFIGGAVAALNGRGDTWVLDRDDLEDPGDSPGFGAGRHE
jgi:uncharacterized membrane protein YtjA (UPF0391 family)